MRLLYRADGGHPIGTGHLLRARRLIDALRRKTSLQSTLATAKDPAALQIASSIEAAIRVLPPRPDRRAIKPLLEADALLPLIEEIQPDLVVVDMLDTPAEAMRCVAETGVPLLTLDDRGEGRRYADGILNVLVEEPEPRHCRRLWQGPRYATLDPAYLDRVGAAPPPAGPVEHVLVSMGGADAVGLTLLAGQALVGVDGIRRVHFACGVAFPHMDELRAIASAAPWEAVITTAIPNLADAFQRSDLALVAGGFTMYESCCIGVPSLAVCQPIDHQVELADRLAGAGAMLTVGDGAAAGVPVIRSAVKRLCGDLSLRQQLASTGPTVVDGAGAERAAEAMLSLVASHGA